VAEVEDWGEDEVEGWGEDEVEGWGEGEDEVGVGVRLGLG